MIGIKCAGCGRAFEVADEQSGKNAKCPDCGAIVFVPTVGSGRIEVRPSEAPTEKVEKPKHLLSPLEMMLILVILVIMIVFVVYRVLEKPEAIKPVENIEQVQRQIEEERLRDLCAGKLEKIGAALLEYREKYDTFPLDLITLKEEGLFPAGIPLACEKSHEEYMVFMQEAIASEGVVEDPILIADSSQAHGAGRLVFRMSDKVEFLSEESFKEIIAAQKVEFGKLDASKTVEKREKDKSEQEASELLITAATAKNSGKPEEAYKIYEKLKAEYGETEVVKKSLSDIDAEIEKISFNMAVENARLLVRTLRLEEAKGRYVEIAKNVTDEYAKIVDSELDAIKLIENGRSLQTLGDLGGALEQYRELGSTHSDPFWKKIAHGLSEEIDNYRKDAAKFFASAENALKSKKSVRAFGLFMSVVDNYEHSAQAPKAKEQAGKLVGEMPYKERFLSKKELIKEESAIAIGNALAWLAVNQGNDGSWQGASKGESAIDGVGLTGLAVLCFLAEGNTHLFGPNRSTVAAAANMLKAAQQESGLIGNPSSPLHRLSHAFAFLALTELYCMTDDEELAPVCQKALDYAIRIQEPGTGWRISDKNQTVDVMLTTWMQLGMLSAAKGELKFLKGLLDGALNTYNAASDADGLIGYSKSGEMSRPERNLPGYQLALIATSASSYGKLVSGSKKDSLKMKGAVEFIHENLPDHNRTSFPLFFFGTYALYQLEERTYTEWKWALNSVLLKSQLREGVDTGAWDMGQYSDFRGGKIYPTALAILALQAPYNHIADIDIRRKSDEEKPSGPEVTLVTVDGARLTGTLVSEDEKVIVIEVVRSAGSAKIPFNKSDLKEIIRK